MLLPLPLSLLLPCLLALLRTCAASINDAAFYEFHPRMHKEGLYFAKIFIISSIRNRIPTGFAAGPTMVHLSHTRYRTNPIYTNCPFYGPMADSDWSMLQLFDNGKVKVDIYSTEENVSVAHVRNGEVENCVNWHTRFESGEETTTATKDQIADFNVRSGDRLLLVSGVQISKTDLQPLINETISVQTLLSELCFPLSFKQDGRVKAMLIEVSAEPNLNEKYLVSDMLTLGMLLAQQRWFSQDSLRKSSYVSTSVCRSSAKETRTTKLRFCLGLKGPNNMSVDSMRTLLEGYSFSTIFDENVVLIEDYKQNFMGHTNIIKDEDDHHLQSFLHFGLIHGNKLWVKYSYWVPLQLRLVSGTRSMVPSSGKIVEGLVSGDYIAIEPRKMFETEDSTKHLQTSPPTFEEGLFKLGTARINIIETCI